MNEFITEQENFWSGEFGDAYTNRNQGDRSIAANTALFGKILARTQGLNTVLELGANIGLNQHALHSLLPFAQLHAVEINARAANFLRELSFVSSVYHGSILEYIPPQGFDLVFTKGVLIHLPPLSLPDVYDLMVEASNRYVMVAEYYNPYPIEVAYRGHEDRLWKRDFAGEIMERHPSLRLLDYGFCYRRDPNWPQDDVTWFLMDKT